VRYFCTYFDQRFLYRGLALYESLRQHAGDFLLVVLCFDKRTHEILSRLALPSMELIRLNDFEAAHPVLITVKAERTFVEYFLTCTPLLPAFILRERPEVEQIAYLDADLFFYDNIQPVYDEWGDGSIYLVPHRFSPANKQRGEINGGRFNVGLVGFRRDAAGMDVLDRWTRQCLEWCFLRVEPGRLGDQKYLDDWPEQFKGVVVSENHGVGAGGWNISSYRIYQQAGQIYLGDTPLVMLHLNFIELLNSHAFMGLNNYSLRPIYQSYAKALRVAIRLVKQAAPDYRAHYMHISLLQWISRLIRGGIIFF